MSSKINPIQFDFYKRRMPELIERFPNLFNKFLPEPLAVGITQELVELTDFSYREMSALIKVWTNRHEYMMMLCSVGNRQDLQGRISLVKPEHLAHAASRIGKYHLNMVASFARNFEIKYGRKPFGGVPEDKNPMFKDGFVEKPIPPYVGKIYDAVTFYLTADDGEVFQKVAGRILGDTATYGNHPFVDGAQFNTSRVVSITKIGDVTFVFTLFSVYMIIGELRDVDG